jgi:hypothetical protein
MAKVDGRKNRKKVKKPLKPSQRKKLAKAMEGNQNAIGNEGGRPHGYDPKKAKHIYKLLLMMVPVKDICRIQDISEATFFRWKDEIPEFRDLVYRGQYGVDEDIIVSLRNKAKGYSLKVVKPFKVRDDKTGADKIINHEYREHHPPDVRAIEMYLRNRTNTKTGWSNLPSEDTPPPPPIIHNNMIDLSQLDDATIRKIIAAVKSGKP